MSLPEVLAELQRRQRRNALLDGLHPGQRRILDAMRSNRFVAVRSPRRWGKTEASLRIGLDLADRMDARCVYISMFRNDAKQIAWPILRDLVDGYLGWAPNLTDLAYRGPHNREIVVLGADRDDLKKKLRGWKNAVVIIDEAQDWSTDLRPFINSVLRHTLTDLRGFLIVLGTPGWQETGFYHTASEGKEPEWARVVGGMLENPHTATQQSEEIEAAKAANPGVEHEPWFRREFCGEWVVDNRRLVYPFSDHNILHDWEPKAPRTHILAIDWGGPKPSAFVVCEFDTKSSDKLDYVDAMQEADMSLDRYVQVVSDMRDRWSPTVIVADPGGTNKALTDEISMRCRIPIQNAEKTDKDAAIAAMVRDLSLGTLRVASPEAEPLLACWRNLSWFIKPDGTREERGENHLADAALYARRAAWNWTYKPKKQKETEEQRMYAEALERAKRAQKRQRGIM